MNKKDFLMIYENQWNIPNGDPFTGEQRYDDVSGKALVSDFRIKRFIRDKFIELLDEPTFYEYDEVEIKKFMESFKKGTTDKLSGASVRYSKFIEENPDLKDLNVYEIMLKFIDVRLFGGVMTGKGNTAAMTGSVQFRNLSESLNRVELKTLQNTSIFPSDSTNEQGAMGTTSLVPYSVFAIEGWLDEKTANLNNLTQEDIDKMLGCYWLGIRDKNTKSKSGQTPIVLFEIDYKPKTYKYNKSEMVYDTIDNISSHIKIITDIEDEEIRSSKDYELNIDSLINVCSNDNVEVVYFYTQREDIRMMLETNDKFKFKEIY